MRRDLRDKGVQNIVIGTIPEQMMFDVRWFVVEAGKPVQLTLTNSDFMPHNIIVGAPGSINPIGPRPRPCRRRARLMRGPTSPICRPCWRRSSCAAARPVGHASNSPRRRSRANTTSSVRSPATGCRMYGVMLVVPSLDAFEAKPTVPNDPMTGKPYESQRVTMK